MQYQQKVGHYERSPIYTREMDKVVIRQDLQLQSTET